MCLTCGCCLPVTSHNDPRNITLADLSNAADAAGIDLTTAVANITAAVATILCPDTIDDDLTGTIIKSLDEQRYVLGVAYQAGNDPKIGVGADGFRDFMKAETVEKCAWEYITKSRVGLHHADGTLGAARIVESYVYRGPDWLVGDALVKSGDWLLGAILTPESWAMRKSGLITGWSPQGTARRRLAKGALHEPPSLHQVNLAVTSRHQEFLSSFVGLCKTIEYLGSVGASRSVVIDVDGDGSADLRFDFGDTDTSSIEPVTETGSGQVRVPGLS